ncbi:putative esterase C31F10.02 [Elaeis guineensis]|uniref:putative esterase C31F10.02 n=1 Tax=Elaeis guineensis var. tenera TaxID=51953 RepID=UPI003C6D8707
MDFEAVKRSLEAAAEETLPSPSLDTLPSKFYDAFVLHGLRVDLVEPGRLLCSMTVPPRLLNTGNFLHGGATASLVDLVGSAAFYTAGARTKGSPLEMSIAYLDAAFVHVRSLLLIRTRFFSFGNMSISIFCRVFFFVCNLSCF